MAKKLLKRLQDFIDKSKYSGIVIAFISFLAIFLFSFSELYEQFEYKLYDWRFTLKPSIDEWENLAFLDVDESSLKNLGEYPWPRNIYAKGLDVLNKVGIRQNAFDFEFIDRSPDMINPEALNELRNKLDGKKKILQGDLNSLVINNDKIFAASAKNSGGVIFPFHFYDNIEYAKQRADISREYRRELDEAKEIFFEKASIKIPEKELEKYNHFLDRGRAGIAMPIPELIKAARSFGYTDRDPDIDGTERRIKLLRVYNGRLFFQLGLAMLMDACEVKKEDVEIIPGKRITLKGAFNPLLHIKKDIVIPIDEKGMIYINWAGPGRLEESFQHIPFYALLEYPRVMKEVHDYFDEQDEKIGNWELTQLKGELDLLRKEYPSIKDLNFKKEKWENLNIIKKQIQITEKRYTKPLIDEIRNLKGESAKNENPELRRILSDYEMFKTAIDIVTQVESLQDKMTIVGLTAAGTQDLGVIPIYNEYMMVGTYHNVINTILQDSFIVRVNKAGNIIIMFVLAILMGVIIQRIGAKMSFIAIVGFILLVNILNVGFFAMYNIWFDLVGANLSIFIPAFIIAGIKLVTEESQKRYLKSAFSRYLSPGVIDKIIASPEALELGGENRIITIFFSDVAKFSTISEKLSPPELVNLLNEYLSEMTDIILSHGGTVDKYEGDAIMAFYGAPHVLEDHALKCCLAAIDMKRRLKEMQEVWRKLGKDELHVRMGMNSGEAVVGNMGSRTRMDYTAMGDSVNLASRLEGANKYYKTKAMISEPTYKFVKDHVEARKLDVIRVVGKEEPIRIYELLGKKGALPDKIYSMLEKYDMGQDYFYKRDWKEALSYFKESIKIITDDGPSLTFIERCEKFLKKPPPKKWDGVYKLTGK